MKPVSARRSYSSYNDGCAAAHALDLIGERWTLIVVRELFLGPKRFAELQRDVVGIGPTVLSRRLRDLESRGIVVRSTLPAPAKVDVYSLTPWGVGLEGVNNALSMWAVSSPTFPWDADMGPDTLVLSMRAHARGVPALAAPVRVTLLLSDSRIEGAEPVSYSALIGAQVTTIEKAPTPPEADAEVRATTADWKACIIGGAAPREAKGVRMAGDVSAVDALLEATALEADEGAARVAGAEPTTGGK